MRQAALNQAKRARRHRFQRLVAQALDSLPPPVQRMLDNVAIVVEDEPTPDHLRDGGSGQNEADDLFGLYQGVPRTQRDSGYHLVTPDRIIIFAGPLERAFVSPGAIREQVRITVLHELAHHVGFDEDAMESLGLA